MHIVTHCQIRGARTFLGLTQAEVADRIGLGRRTMMAWESGTQLIPVDKMKLLVQFYQDQGIEFLEDEGFIQRKPVTNLLSGENGFQIFFDDIYKFCKAKQNEGVCVLGVNEEPFKKLSFADLHIERMSRLKAHMKVIVEEKPNIMHTYATYRCIAQEYFDNVPMYIFGNRVGIIDWDKMQILYIHNETVAAAFLKIFNALWSLAKPL